MVQLSSLLVRVEKSDIDIFLIMVVEKLNFVILSLSLITGLLADGQLMSAIIDDGEVHNREVRSWTDGLGWHLDRIDQRSLPLDGHYSPMGNGKLDHYYYT